MEITPRYDIEKECSAQHGKCWSCALAVAKTTARKCRLCVHNSIAVSKTGCQYIEAQQPVRLPSYDGTIKCDGCLYRIAGVAARSAPCDKCCIKNQEPGVCYYIEARA